jgi:hypothetical protein
VGGLVGIIISIIMHPSSFVIRGHLTCNLSKGGDFLNKKKVPSLAIFFLQIVLNK